MGQVLGHREGGVGPWDSGGCGRKEAAPWDAAGLGMRPVLAAVRHSPEPSRLLYKVPLMFRQRTGSSLSYTEGSQLYLVPPFSWTEARGAGGDGGPGRRKQRGGTSRAQQAPPPKGKPTSLAARPGLPHLR